MRHKKKFKKQLFKVIKKLGNHGNVNWGIDVVDVPYSKKPVTKYVISVYLDENIWKMKNIKTFEEYKNFLRLNRDIPLYNLFNLGLVCFKENDTVGEPYRYFNEEQFNEIKNGRN